jgi:hypothetical protein
MSLRSIAIAALAVTAAPASAADPAPKDCGKTPSGRHFLHVDAGSKCDFGIATYRALKAYDEAEGFIPAVEKDFVLKVAYRGRKVKLDCRALVRAHGEFDYYCNNLNRWRGTRVVRFDNATLP